MIVADPADPIADFITLKDEDRLLDYPTDGACIINKNLGENLKLTVGDTLTVYDSDMREMDLTIAALCENHVYNYVYIDLDTYRGAWGRSGNQHGLCHRTSRCGRRFGGPRARMARS